MVICQTKKLGKVKIKVVKSDVKKLGEKLRN